jgi:aarF domain-containing kinase
MVPKSILSLAINVVALLPTTALQGKRGLRLLSTVRPAIVVDGKGSMSTSMKDLSAQIKEMRGSLVEDERTAMMIDALRGKNMNDDDAQRAGIKMRLVESERRADASSDSLPTLYDPVKLQKYFSARPGVVATRMWQVSSSTASFFAGVLSDYLRGKLADTEVRRAAELRNTIVSLGPFFIKLGQALSIRPDLLSPRAMVELQQLCDKVPCFDSALAMRTIEQEFGRPVAEIFSTISPEPVAAASLGQVRHTFHVSSPCAFTKYSIQMRRIK